MFNHFQVKVIDNGNMGMKVGTVLDVIMYKDKVIISTAVSECECGGALPVGECDECGRMAQLSRGMCPSCTLTGSVN